MKNRKNELKKFLSKSFRKKMKNPEVMTIPNPGVHSDYFSQLDQNNLFIQGLKNPKISNCW